ncbi:MAG: hypothetical protein AB1503_02235 [Bacillota bacterium]
MMVIHCAHEIRSGQIAAWHGSLWEQGVTSCALTCLRSVRDSLSNLGIPVFRLEPPVESIRATLRLVESRGQTHRAEEGQLAVVLVEGEPPSQTDDPYEREHARLQAQAVLVHGGRQMRAAVLHLGGFLRHLMRCGLAERVGQGIRQARGRPQVIYRLKLADWNAAEGV